jgi:tripartite-type tricarboxylate transporter receptor subunit TctC
MLAPAHTAEAIVRKVNADLKTVLEDAEVRKRFEQLGTYARAMSPPRCGNSRPRHPRA